MAWLIHILRYFIANLFPLPETPPRELPMNEETNQEKLLRLAMDFQGEELSPLDPVEDNVACVDSLTNLLRIVYPDFPKEYHTAVLVTRLKQSPYFKGTLDLEPGNIIVNATGSGFGNIRGHCGVIGMNGVIYSNDSRTGLWLDHYTISTWTQRYRIKGGMPTLVFKPL